MPENLENYIESLHKTFPKIFDTKFLLSSSLKTTSLVGQTSDLKSSFEKILEAFRLSKEKYKLSASLPEDCEEYGMCLKGEGDFGLAHDAGFDSFLTGTLFFMLSKILKIPSENSYEHSFYANKVWIFLTSLLHLQLGSLLILPPLNLIIEDTQSLLEEY